jgi:predicted Zn-dependent protease
VVRVGPGDTSRRLADKFPFEAFRLRWFEILNGLSPGQELQPGRSVKIVVQ